MPLAKQTASVKMHPSLYRDANTMKSLQDLYVNTKEYISTESILEMIKIHYLVNVAYLLYHFFANNATALPIIEKIL